MISNKDFLENIQGLALLAKAVALVVLYLIFTGVILFKILNI